MRVAAPFLVVAVLLAGCASEPASEAGGDDAPPPLPPPPPLESPTWSTPVLLDETRAGGEPVLAITHAGTILVGAHPGYTHYHPDATAVPPTGAELLVPSQGQSYLWRSTDNGTTWRHVGLLPVESPNSGPRGVGQGVSDPDFTVAPDGRIYFTDLESLATASVSWSDDDGATWLLGNNVVSERDIDRQWLASYGDEVYFLGTDRINVNTLRVSTDGGLTWTSRGDADCGGDLVAHPTDGRIFVGCGNGVSVSRDGGATWERSEAPVAVSGHGMTEPALDTAGNVYMAADPAFSDIVLLTLPDGATKWKELELKSYFPALATNGSLLWPWVSAGSEGRVSVTFLGSPSPRAWEDARAEWFVYNALVLDATTRSPHVFATRVTTEPVHVGAICQNGTTCQAFTAVDDGSDRRLGDFFETTIDHDGYVVMAFSDTHHRPSDVISHPAFVRQTGGPRLFEGDARAGFPTQG